MIIAAGLSTMAAAQEKFEQGKPNDDNYRYIQSSLILSWARVQP